jgi:tetratricopeptide (TPR) repeat protein
MSKQAALRAQAIKFITQDKEDIAEGILIALASLDDKDTESRLYLAHIAREKQDYTRAKALYTALLKENNTAIAGLAGLALTLFREEKFKEAWSAYEVRFTMQKKPPTVTIMQNGERVPITRWNGEGHPEHLLVMAEQGLGDTLQFARYLIALSERGIKTSLVAPKRLHALLKTIKAEFTLLPLEESHPVRAKVWCTLLDLPQILKINSDDYAKPATYLSSSPALIKTWGEKMQKEAKGARLKIGIIWQGNPDLTIDQGRSMPLESFKPLANLPDVALFSLQKGHGEEQLEKSSFRNRIIELKNVDAGENGFIDTAAIMHNLDFIISTCTSTPHLAGALGIPVKLLLKKQGADWRWLAREKTSIWYPNHTLYRQKKSGDWAGLIEQIIAELKQSSPSIIPDLSKSVSRETLLAVIR